MATRAQRGSGAQPESVFSGQHDRRKVTDWVYEEIKRAIVELRLPPRHALREATLAEQLGVSKTPIREAVTRLEQEGLVETTSFKGAVVTEYSRQDLIELYELRELLEIAAVRTAAESMTDEDRGRLQRISEESKKLKKGNASRLATLISQFDDVLFEQVHNTRIQALIENLRAHLTRIGHLTEGLPGRIEASVEEHERIVEAIAARDPAAAEKHLRDHIRSVRDDQLQALDEVASHA